MRSSGRIERVGRAAKRRLQPTSAFAAPLDEVHTDLTDARLDRHSHLHPCINDVTADCGILHSQREVGVAAERGKMNALTIDEDFELMRGLQTADGLDVAAKQLDLKLILGVEWERVSNEHAADGAEREPFDLLVLRHVLADAVDLGAGTDLHIPERQGADLVRSRQYRSNNTGDTPSTSAILSNP